MCCYNNGQAFLHLLESMNEDSFFLISSHSIKGIFVLVIKNCFVVVQSCSFQLTFGIQILLDYQDPQHVALIFYHELLVWVPKINLAIILPQP